MKPNELRNKSAVELTEKLHSLLKDQFNLRMQKGLGETPKSHTFKELRKDIARVKTILTEKVQAKDE